MNERHLEDAFAPVPQAVLDHIDEALMEVQAMNQKHRKPVLAIALVAVLILALAGTAIATGIRWGMSDFLTQGTRIGDILPEVRDAIQTSVRQAGGSLDGVTFTLQEALCDGKYAWMLFDVTSSEKGTLLVANEMSVQAPANRLSAELPEDRTIAQWAEENGYTRITTVRLEQEPDTQDEFTIERLSWHWQPDGAISVMIMGPYQKQTAGDVHFVCQAMPWWGDGAEQHSPQKELITVTLAPGEPLWTAEWSGSAMIPDSDITIEHIGLVGTIAGMYAELTYEGTQDIHEKGVLRIEWLRLVDEDGKELFRGAGTGLDDIRRGGGETAGVKLPLGDHRFLQAMTYAALPEPPEILRVSAIRSDNSETVRLGVVEIPLK